MPLDYEKITLRKENLEKHGLWGAAAMGLLEARLVSQQVAFAPLSSTELVDAFGGSTTRWKSTLSELVEKNSIKRKGGEKGKPYLYSVKTPERKALEKKIYGKVMPSIRSYARSKRGGTLSKDEEHAMIIEVFEMLDDGRSVDEAGEVGRYLIAAWRGGSKEVTSSGAIKSIERRKARTRARDASSSRPRPQLTELEVEKDAQHPAGLL